MGILSRLLRQNVPVSADSGVLREQLFGAVAAGDQRSFKKLCRKNADQIVGAFAKWQTVPAGIRSDPAAVGRYGQALMSVAQYFAESLGRREPLDLLTGPDDTNPITKWENAIATVDELIKERRYREAAELTRAVLPELESLAGPSVARMLSTTLARLGTSQFHLGEVEAAKTAVERALILSEQCGDIAGIANNLKELYEIERFLGDSEAAGSCATRLSSLLAEYASPQESETWRRKAERVRQDEPLSRVVVEVAGQRYELDELATIPAEIEGARFAFERNRESLGSVAALVGEGKQLGSAQQFEAALKIFERAAAIDPADPDPHYQRATTLMHLQRYVEAASTYEHVERLAPGWYHCRSELSLAKHLATGKVNHATFLLLRELEDGSTSREEKIALATEALAQARNVALLHLLLGENLFGIGRREEAKAAFLKGLECADEPDIETRLLFDLAAVTGSKDEKEELLQRVVAIKGNLVSVAMAALLLRHHIQ